MNMEDKEFMEKYILNNSFEFKQGIISHCREMDKIDVYNWVAEDELKIDKLQQENKQLQKDIKNIIKILDKNCDDLEATEEEFDSLDRWQGLQVVELEQGSDSNVKD